MNRMIDALLELHPWPWVNGVKDDDSSFMVIKDANANVVPLTQRYVIALVDEYEADKIFNSSARANETLEALLVLHPTPWVNASKEEDASWLAIKDINNRRVPMRVRYVTLLLDHYVQFAIRHQNTEAAEPQDAADQASMKNVAS